jgi:hypothetical protein
MLTIACLSTLGSAALLTLPRVVGTAVELGLTRDAAVAAWQFWAGRLWMQPARLPASFGARRGTWARGGRAGLLQGQG